MADSTGLDTAKPSVDTAENWNNRYQRARMARMNFERKWYTYLAFVSGKQYLRWDYTNSPTSVGQLIEPLNPQGRVRITVNKTRKILRKELAKINKEEVRGYVVPTNTDNNSQAAARGAESLATYFTAELRLQDTFKRADWWMLQCGTSFIKTYYDPNVPMGFVKQQMPMQPGMIQQPGQQTPMQMVPVNGAPVAEAVDPFHILVPNLDEPDIQKQEWVMHVAMKSPDYVKERFGVSMDGVSVSTDTLESRIMMIQGMTTDANKNKAVEIREIWIKPSPGRLKGALITCTQDKILEVQNEFPYAHGKYPFAKRTYIENSIFYGATLVEDIMPLQIEYNRVRSQIIEDKNRMGRPMLAAEKGSIDVKKLRGVAGDVVEYLPGTRQPSPIDIQGLPNYIIDHMNRCAAEMAELASQEQQDGQTLPQGVTAATAIAYLYENQDALIADTLRDKERCWEQVIQQILSYAGQFWDAQRLVTVSGKNGNFETFMFGQSDLMGQTNWRSVVGSATPQAYSAKQAQIMELMKMGAVPVAEALQFLEMGDTARLYEDMQRDKNEAEKENVRLGNSVYAPVELWQEHLLHLTYHDDMRKREEYESWDQQAKQMIAYHAVTHMEMFLQEAGWPGPVGPDGMIDPNFLQMKQQYMQQGQQAMAVGGLPQVPPQYEMTLRSAIHQLTMAPAPGPASGPPPPIPAQGGNA